MSIELVHSHGVYLALPVLTGHVVTTTLLLNVHTTLGARLRSNLLDCLLGLSVFLRLGLAAATRSMRCPGTVTRQANLIVAIWAFDHLLGTLVAPAVSQREIHATFFRETGDIGFAGGKSVPGEGLIVSVTFCQYLSLFSWAEI